MAVQYHHLHYQQDPIWESQHLVQAQSTEFSPFAQPSQSIPSQLQCLASRKVVDFLVCDLPQGPELRVVKRLSLQQEACRSLKLRISALCLTLLGDALDRSPWITILCPTSSHTMTAQSQEHQAYLVEFRYPPSRSLVCSQPGLSTL